MADFLRRWATSDPESAPGSVYNSESPESPARIFTYPGPLGPLVGGLSVALQRLRPEETLELTTDGLTVGSGPQFRQVNWVDVDRIEAQIAYPRRDHGPLIKIVTRQGEVVPVPDRLYPDAASDYPSKRHVERAREIAAVLKEACETHRLQDDE